MIEGLDHIGKYVAESDDGHRFYYLKNKDEAISRMNANPGKQRNALNKLSISDLNSGRNVFLFDGFWEEPAEDTINKIMDFDSTSNEPINVYINSPGGYVDCLYAIASGIRGVKSEVRTICMGEAASCGAVLLSIGNKRYAGKYSSIMIHDPMCLAWGNIEDMEKTLGRLNSMKNELIDMMVEKSGQSKEVFAELMKSDFYMNSEQAADLGLVDGILDVEEKNSGFINSLLRKTSMFSGKRLENAMLQRIYESKGASDMMGKAEMLDKLRDDFGINVLDLQVKAQELEQKNQEIEEKDQKIAELEEKTAEAEKKAEEEEAAKEEEEIENILKNLILDCKSTQIMNDEVYRQMFKAVGSEQARLAASKLPVIVKTNGEASTDEPMNLDPKTVEGIRNLVFNKMKEMNIENTEGGYLIAYQELEKEGLV